MIVHDRTRLIGLPFDIYGFILYSPNEPLYCCSSILKFFKIF
ncbi:hypothetical protein AO385_1845 [Moraxella catarrhalis]|uniref:Uncharacterized protein n=1 Tax=Moraxella catarrhalis TaxID=480 RepID=A0A198UGS0_MORCA|nr:hypothetical protein AO384_1207 [Moraxella catarrhalis]OAU96392.1 hypothetical protein AO385_1845 [Moraxella catarrhalis]OAU97352.1 hypothetical protein AO383_0912 [Moraxella catarrhalis]OAV00611.1 hypothetical protein AO382_1344 [Moraxella catarrhalis]